MRAAVVTLYGRVVDGVLVQVGDLPSASIRLSTNQIIYDLAGSGAKWQTDCGWFDLAVVDPTVLTSDPVKQAQLVLDIAAAQAGEDGRSAFLDRVRTTLDMARDSNWDWIDRYCHGAVANIPFIRDQSPDAGAVWGTLLQNDKAEAVRLGASLALAENIRLAQLCRTLMDLLAQLYAANPTLAIPPDR